MNTGFSVYTYDINLNEVRDVWRTSDEIKYQWGVGNAGELMILKSEYSTAFSAQKTGWEKVFCYAPGTWARVEMDSDDPAEEEADHNERKEGKVVTFPTKH